MKTMIYSLTLAALMLTSFSAQSIVEEAGS